MKQGEGHGGSRAGSQLAFRSISEDPMTTLAISPLRTNLTALVVSAVLA
jgi:hypothetical protein